VSEVYDFCLAINLTYDDVAGVNVVVTQRWRKAVQKGKTCENLTEYFDSLGLGEWASLRYIVQKHTAIEVVGNVVLTRTLAMLKLAILNKTDDVAVGEQTAILYLLNNLGLGIYEFAADATHYKHLQEVGGVVLIYSAICFGIKVVFYESLNHKTTNAGIVFK
jgi:hypothetical protein